MTAETKKVTTPHRWTPERTPALPRILRRVSHRLTKHAAVLLGDRVPICFVVEYPKSGGTWLARMLSHSIDLPFCEFSLLPLTFSCVSFAHWPYDPRLRRCVYIHRDGRDVLVSLYHHRRRLMAMEGSAPGRRWRRVFGPPAALPDHAALALDFERFLQIELQRTRGGTGWSAHISGWMNADESRVRRVAYESLLADTPGQLAACARFASDEAADPDRVRQAVDLFSFERMTGRRSGEEDRSSFVRKGIVGDWRNHFSRDAARLFDAHHGAMLVRLGYEPDRSWPDVYEPPA